MIRILLSVGTLLITSLAFAQSSYVVTVTGDTLLGEVKLISGGTMDRVQLNSNSKKTTYTAFQARAARANNETYHALQLGTSYRFMKLIKEGHLSIYGYRIETQTSYDGRLLRKANGESFDVPTIAFRGSVLNFIADCESAAQAVKEQKLGREDLEAIANAYNDCMNQKLKQNYLNEQKTIVARSKRARVEDFLKVVSATNLDNKAEVEGLLNDMITKIEAGQSIPSYQKNALIDYLKDMKEFKESLDKLFADIQ